MTPVDDPSVGRLGARALSQRLRQIGRNTRGVRRSNIGAVHDMRVASRRLRAVLQVFHDCFKSGKADFWRKSAKRLTKALGRARDLDVQIAFLDDVLSSLTDPALRPGIEFLYKRLVRERRRTQPALNKALDRWSDSRTPQKLRRSLTRLGRGRSSGPSLAVLRLAHDVVAARLDELLQYTPFVLRPECETELHKMRIAAKHLRYTLETFEPVLPELQPFRRQAREIQDLLGSFHDCTVWIQTLAKLLDDVSGELKKTSLDELVPGFLFLRQDRLSRRDDFYRRFVVYWNELTHLNTWPRLLDTLSDRAAQSNSN